MGVLERLNLRRRTAQAGSGRVVDRLGRSLEPGDLFVQQNPDKRSPLLRVVAITPQMDPTGPQGTLLHAVGEFTFLIPLSGMADCLRVSEAEVPANGDKVERPS